MNDEKVEFDVKTDVVEAGEKQLIEPAEVEMIEHLLRGRLEIDELREMDVDLEE